MMSGVHYTIEFPMPRVGVLGGGPGNASCLLPARFGGIAPSLPVVLTFQLPISNIPSGLLELSTNNTALVDLRPHRLFLCRFVYKVENGVE
jgi:hypothetical protein